MLRLCTAATLPEAHLLRDLLAQAGIEAMVFNENAQGGLGELPFTHAWPEIWIASPSDSERARGIVAAQERPVPAGPDRPCLACGEANPFHFQLCWQCGHEF
jgi:hypothetical protein